MEHGTTVLLGLSGVAVRRVELAAAGIRVVHVVTAEEAAAACPECGVFFTSVKGNVTTRPKDLPYGPAPVGLVWHKRRWRCREVRCGRASFTEQLPQVPAGARRTGRLRAALADAVVANRCVDEVARSHAVSWPTVARAVTTRAGQVLGEPTPTPVLGNAPPAASGTRPTTATGYGCTAPDQTVECQREQHGRPPKVEEPANDSR